MSFDIPKPSYVFNYEGWFKIKSNGGYGFNGQAIHYFFKSKKSICGRVKDSANILIRCENVEYKKCGLCKKQLERYSDLNNLQVNPEE